MREVKTNTVCSIEVLIFFGCDISDSYFVHMSPFYHHYYVYQWTLLVTKSTLLCTVLVQKGILRLISVCSLFFATSRLMQKYWGKTSWTMDLGQVEVAVQLAVSLSFSRKLLHFNLHLTKELFLARLSYLMTLQLLTIKMPKLPGGCLVLQTTEATIFVRGTKKACCLGRQMYTHWD